MSVTIGKSASEVERPQVPQGIVHQRRALFGGQGLNTLSFSTPEAVPSTSSMSPWTEFSETRQNHVKVAVTRVHAPPELIRRSVDEDVGRIQRSIVLMRSNDPGPSVSIREVHMDSNPRHERGLRRYPVVSVNISDPPKRNFNSNWKALPPSSNHRTPITVHRNYSSTPSGLNYIRSVEESDSVAVDYRPRKQDSKENQDNEVETEIAAREMELENAKRTIQKLSMDLARLENDKNALEESVIVEEDIDMEELDERSDDRDTKVKLDAETILRECNRIMEQLRKEEEADAELLEKIQKGDSSGEEVEREIMRLQRQVAELNAMGVELPPMTAKQGSQRGKEDTSQILSLKDQAVMFSSGSNTRQEALISRLERELTDAQTCNHRLNAQLGSLASNGDSTLKREYIEIKKALKDRNDELEQLRKKVQKHDKDRQQWENQKKQLESKLPVDVQQLMAQKKELTTQLDREQSEKQELFMQMNTYIAQLADAGDAEVIKKEAEGLRKKVNEMQGSIDRLQLDLSRSKDDVAVVKKSFEAEKKQLASDAEEARRELNMKSAALQSLMLAKQDNGKIEQLTEENKRMAVSVEELQTNLRDAQLQMAHQLNSKLEQMSTKSSNAAQTELQKRLDEAEARLKTLQEKIDVAEQDKRELQQNLNSKTRDLSSVTDQLKSAQQENELSDARHNAAIVQLQAQLSEAKRGGDDETRKLLENEKILKTTVDETCAKLDATKVALLAAESRAEQAENDLKALDAQMKNAERRTQQLQAQLNAAGDEEKEMELLRDELKKAEERHNLLLQRYQKAEAAVHDNSSSHKVQLEELQLRLERAEKDNREVMEKQNKLESAEKNSAQMITSLEHVKQQAELERKQNMEKIAKLEKDLETARNEKQGQKVAVAEEITTLTNLTHSLRTENSNIQEQIGSLERDIHNLKEELEEKEYENEQLIKELEQARAMADTERQTLTLLKSSQQMGEEESVNLRNDLLHEKEARKKAEADLAAKFGAQIDEISKERTRLREEKSHIETELTEVRKKLDNLEEEHSAGKTRSMEAETRLRAEASKLQTTFAVLEDEKRQLEEHVKEANQSKEQLEKTMEKKVREAKEETEAVRREVDSQRARVQELEEERTREVGSNDEEKKRLLEELRFYREKADSQQLEVASLKTKVTSSSSEVIAHQSKVDQLQSQLDTLQAEYEEMKQVLHSSQESVEKMRESEQMAAKIKKQLEELESEHRMKLKTEMTKREEVERKLDELETSRKQQELLQQSSADSQKEELVLSEQKISDLESKLAVSAKAQAELLTNVKNLTSLVESESKRIEDTATEKRKWQAKAEELERNMKNVEDSEEMRHLVAENARMAGELLQLRSERSQRAESDESSAKELQEKLTEMEQEKYRILSDLQSAKVRSEELNRSIITADKKRRDEVTSVQRELERERSERERLQEKIDNMYSNGHSNGPQRTLSNMSAVTSLTNRDFTEIDDIDELHRLLDKQQRIITVLRRKLLKLQS